jgi:hypothetical protein
MSPPAGATPMVPLYQHYAVSCGSATCVRRRVFAATANPRAQRRAPLPPGPDIVVSTAKCQTRPIDRLTAAAGAIGDVTALKTFPAFEGTYSGNVRESP